MQLWNTHNPFRAVLLCADGYMVMWDYKNSPFLSTFNPLVKEQRSGADLFYFDRGDRIGDAADSFSAEVRSLIDEHGGKNSALAVDKIMLHGLRALEKQGFTVHDGEEVKMMYGLCCMLRIFAVVVNGLKLDYWHQALEPILGFKSAARASSVTTKSSASTPILWVAMAFVSI